MNKVLIFAVVLWAFFQGGMCDYYKQVLVPGCDSQQIDNPFAYTYTVLDVCYHYNSTWNAKFSIINGTIGIGLWPFNFTNCATAPLALVFPATRCSPFLGQYYATGSVVSEIDYPNIQQYPTLVSSQYGADCFNSTSLEPVQVNYTVPNCIVPYPIYHPDISLFTTCNATNQIAKNYGSNFSACDEATIRHINDSSLGCTQVNTFIDTWSIITTCLPTNLITSTSSSSTSAYSSTGAETTGAATTDVATTSAATTDATGNITTTGGETDGLTTTAETISSSISSFSSSVSTTGASNTTTTGGSNTTTTGASNVTTTGAANVTTISSSSSSSSYSSSSSSPSSSSTTSPTPTPAPVIVVANITLNLTISVLNISAINIKALTEGFAASLHIDASKINIIFLLVSLIAFSVFF